MEWCTSFELQKKECERAGNRFKLGRPFAEIAVCVFFKTHCHPDVCLHKRHPYKGKNETKKSKTT